MLQTATNLGLIPICNVNSGEWLSCFFPVWKIWEEFETFLENKLISKVRKKNLGDQIVINSYVYMFFNCDQS